LTEYQQTIKSEVALEGKGVHTGQTTRMVLKPAPPDQGVVFLRSDLNASPPLPADIQYISSSERGTSLRRGAVEVRTVEHLLAALSGLGVDNLTVDMNGPEPPMGDGSSLPFVGLIKTAGLQPQSASRKYLKLRETIYLIAGESVLVGLPLPELRIAFTIDFSHPHLRSQYLCLSLTPEGFEKEIGSARTFGFLRDARPLLEKGLIKGTTLRNTVVIGDDGIVNPEGLRFPDEFVRHKILDLLGDLYLLGHPLQALIVAIKSGHTANLAFVKKIKEVSDGRNQ
jgi:UDP-3-O-[3-hydroxymyristoyl] N-acetylglucosamine deacetylase/3-hydroxyacyl-[acyl-carrier-protein] dehydratase